jgi:hypothetical protein
MESANVLLTTMNQYMLSYCDPNCYTCSSLNFLCLKCQPGFVLKTISQANLCLPCGSFCKTCTADNENVCLSCFADSILINNTCFTCKFPCLTCMNTFTGLTNCTSCPNGYALANGACLLFNKTACDVSCAQCVFISATWTCLNCLPGFTLISGNCVNCVSGCKICSNQNANLCF